MNKFRILLAVLSMAAAIPGNAQTDISGTWTGNLPVGPNTTIEVHFVLTRDGDGYSAMLTSPNPGGIQDTPVTSTTFDDNRLVMTVDSLSGRYEGTFEDGAFSGSWFQQNQEIPLALAPYVERVLSDADKDLLRGSWVGELTTQGVTLTIVCRFEENEAGEFVGFMDSPDQGVNGLPIANIQLADGTFRFQVMQLGGEYSAAFDGDSMDGTWTQLSQLFELDMTRGEYVQRGIELSQEAIDRLEGSWVGRVQNAVGAEVTLVFRFETTADGGVMAFLDSPDQGASGIPVSEVTLEGEQLSLVIPTAQASYTATLSDTEMVGNWAQGNFAQAVTMTRGEYTPTVTPLDLTDEAYERLAGVWRGEMNTIELMLRFETNADGARIASVKSPGEEGDGLAITEASLNGDQLSLGIPAAAVVISGTLDGDTFEARWRQGGAVNNPLTFRRDQ